MKKINGIIDKYRRYGKLYEVLQQFYTESEVSSEDEVEIINKSVGIGLLTLLLNSSIPYLLINSSTSLDGFKSIT